MKIDNNLKWLKISGDAWDVGLQLGKIGKDAVWEELIKCDLWKEIISYKNEKFVKKLHKNTKKRFPLIYEEIQGLAKGLDLPFEDVFLWNCRGDILANTNDGCTTLQIPGEKRTIAHNEDGLPFFKKRCFIVDISVINHPSFISFYYPGSIPGHTFAFNNKGIAIAINNLRLKNIQAQYPRMVIGRAILNCHSLDNIVDLIKNHSNAGGFNFSLASTKDKKLLDVEFGGGYVGVKEIENISLHANHAIYQPLNKKEQIITDSSFHRQARFKSIEKENKIFSPMDILRDTNGDGLPIFRTDPKDPDNENTIASAIFKISQNCIEYTFYESDSKNPSYKGQMKIE